MSDSASTPTAVDLLQREVEEVWHNHRVEVIDELYAPDCIVHSNGEDLEGPEAYKEYVSWALNGFPDLDIVDAHYVGDESEAAVRVTWRGTHENEIEGIPPTGTEVEVEGRVFTRVEEGQVVEMWNLDDRLAMMEQLGVMG